MENSKIEWTDNTFSPWLGCTRVSEGCRFCYAEALTTRYKWAKWGPGQARKRTSAANWKKPLSWNRKAERDGVRRRVFCASLCDVFDHEAPAGARDDLWDLIRKCPALDWQLLTKRPENIERYLPRRLGQGVRTRLAWNNDRRPSGVRPPVADPLGYPLLRFTSSATSLPSARWQLTAETISVTRTGSSSAGKAGTARGP